jgi:pyruvate dehydrogenase E1 component alpha subunit
MIEKGWADAAEIDQMNGEIARAIDEAIEWADNSPYPDPSELLDGVYAPEK